MDEKYTKKEYNELKISKSDGSNLKVYQVSNGQMTWYEIYDEDDPKKDLKEKRRREIL